MPELGIEAALGALLPVAAEAGAEAAPLFAGTAEAGLGLGGEALGALGLEGALGLGGEAVSAGGPSLFELGMGSATGAAEGGLGAALGTEAVTGAVEGGLGVGGEASGIFDVLGLGDASIPSLATEVSSPVTPTGLTQPTAMGGVTSVGAPQSTIDIGALTANPNVTTVGGPTGATALAAPTGVQGGVDLTSLWKNAKDWLGPLIAGGGLGYQVMQGQKDLPSTEALKGQLGQIGQEKQGLSQMGKEIISKGGEEGGALRKTGEEYTKYLAQGTLPPTMQAQLDQEAKDAKAAIVSRYASMGMPTDPMKNSSLQQELAGIDERVRIKSSSLAKDLLQGGSSLIQAGTGLDTSKTASGTGLINTGAQMSGMETGLLTTLAGIDQKQTEAIGKAIANFASALGSMGRPQTKGLTLSVR